MDAVTLALAKSSFKKEIDNLIYSGASAHNSLYRGKNLGSNVTTEQWNAISSGTFDDLYIGDYWKIQGVNWRIAAFDYYFNLGDTPCNTHHIVIIPDTPLDGQPMNSSDTTDNGYTNSTIYISGLNTIKGIVKGIFGENHILTHRQYLCDSAQQGYAYTNKWYDSTVELMTEQNVYGCYIFATRNFSLDNSQFPLFLYDRSAQSMSTTWLRDISSSTSFCYVDWYGYASVYNASYTMGIRPSFCLKG